MNTRTFSLLPRALRAPLSAALAAATLVVVTGGAAHGAEIFAAHASPAEVAAEYAALRAETLARLPAEPMAAVTATGVVTHELTGFLLASAGHLNGIAPSDSLASAVILPERDIVVAAPDSRRLGPVPLPGAATSRVTL